MKKILLSGGWGFGNLGDDAILLSTIRILYNLHSNVEIGVLSYNKQETQYVVHKEFSNIKVYKSVQKVLFGNNFEIQFGVKKFYCSNLLKWIYYKLECCFFYLYKRYPRLLSLLFDNRILPYKKIISSYDVLCFCGGGYLNNWRSSLLSHYIEMIIARNNNIKIHTIGSSVGPFECELYKNMAESILSKCNHISFRDNKSLTYVTKNAYITPDYALYSEKSYSDNSGKRNVDREKRLLYIVGYDNVLSQKEGLYDYFIEIQNKYGFYVTLSVSQLWDVQDTLFVLYEYFKSRGLNCNYIIPKDVIELEEIIKHSTIMLSQNLHPLILAYRNRIPSVSLNNRIKFNAFIELTNGYICPLKDFDVKRCVKISRDALCKTEYYDFSEDIKMDCLNIMK